MKAINPRRRFLAGSLVVAAGGSRSRARPIAGISAAHLRVARATDDLSAVVGFYRDGLGFQVIYEFHDHAGFDGAMLGFPDSPYHLEFTRTAKHRVGRAPDPENLLVLFLPEAATYRAATARMKAHGHRSIRAFNPYWDENGRTYEDPDGYRVVLQNSAWPPVANIQNRSSP
jgi:catechol 2,3-dioxygenase-like lactoylglutathione lyase family enzyme